MLWFLDRVYIFLGCVYSVDYCFMYGYIGIIVNGFVLRFMSIYDGLVLEYF